jgi:ANTH domain
VLRPLHHFSTQIYRAISEGIINLADCFFDMEYTDAQRGLDIYKQHTLDNDKLGVGTCCLPRWPALLVLCLADFTVCQRPRAQY